jgi:hypothetical protein
MSPALARRARSLVAAATLSGALSGCYTPGYNTYATPRTTPNKAIAAGFHLQVTGYTGELENQKNQKYIAPTLPGVSGRIGLGDTWDMGARAGVALPWGNSLMSAVHVGGDIKWLVAPGETLDVALNPALAVTLFSEQTVDSKGYLSVNDYRHWHVDAPVLLGVNLDPMLAVVASPGVLLGWYAPEVTPFDETRRGRLVDGVAPRLGVGLNVRTSQGFALQPEATLVYATAEHNRRFIYTFGLGFQLGKLPKILRPPDARATLRSPQGGTHESGE